MLDGSTWNYDFMALSVSSATPLGNMYDFGVGKNSKEQMIKAQRE